MQKMNGIKLFTLLLVVALNACILLAVPVSDSDSSLSDLYENLLQREYTGPISFPNHQVERKAQRSPSLRLRFGRRSDPALSAMQLSKLLEKRFNGEINQKPIRSPSLRLRYGKRDPSLMSSYYDEDSYSNDIDLNREIRVPTTRLRWGRRDTSIPILSDDWNEYEGSPDKRKTLRLRYGRSYNSDVKPFETESSLTETDHNDEHVINNGLMER